MAFSPSSRWFKHGAYSLFNRMGVVFFGFLNVFFMVRMMSKEEVGVWALFVSVTSILELMRNGFIRGPLITHLVSAKTAEERANIMTSSLVLHLILVAFTSLFMLFGAVPLTKFWNAPELDILFYIYIIRGLILIPSLHFEYLQQSKVEFQGIFLANVAKLAPLAIYIIVKYFLGLSVTLVELSIVQLFSSILSVIVAYPFVKDDLLFSRSINLKNIKEQFSYGKYTLATTISSMFIRSTDTWMIGRMISPIGVASYNPALRISNLVEVPTLAVANLVFSQVNRKMEDSGNRGIQEVYVKSVSLILAMMMPMVIPLYVMSDFIITLIFTESFAEAGPILRVTIFFMLIIPFNRQFGTVLDGLKRPQLNFYLLLVMGVLNVIFNYIFLQSMGLIGAAYGTLLSYSIIFIINQVMLHRMFGINTFKVFPGIIEWYVIGWNFFWEKVNKIMR